jgi:plasmid stability protein
MMPSVQIKGVPDQVHRELRRRAAAAGQSLQDYLLDRLMEEVRYPPLAEVLDRAGGRSGGRLTFEDAAAGIREDRESR